MLPASKKLEGHIASGSFVRTLRFLMHSVTSMHGRILKFHIWIPHDKIADIFFLVRIIPFPELGPLEKKLNEMLSAKDLKNY